MYDTCLSKPENQPADWGFSFSLRPEQVWDGVVTLALLEDHKERGEILEVPHGQLQQDRFSAAIHDRNERFEKYGQPEWDHWCDKCVRFYPPKDGEPLRKFFRHLS